MLVEYGLIIAGVALVSAAGVSMFGHKTNDLIAAVAAVLPCAHSDDNGPMISGKLIETTAPGVVGSIAVDVVELESKSNTGRLGNSVLGVYLTATALAA